MSKITPEETIAFLLSCIRHSNAGKTDFAEVAKECSIVSAGAAAKRFSRLTKSVESGASSTKNGDNDTPATSPRKDGAGTKRKTTSKATPTKKARALKKAAVAAAEDLVEKTFGVREEDGDSSSVEEGMEVDEA